jgi:hypothetical protein
MLYKFSLFCAMGDITALGVDDAACGGQNNYE